MTPVQLQNLLQQGVAHHRAGRLDEAGACYARARAGAPRSFDAWHLAGVVALQQGRGEAAAGLLRRATALNPRSAPAAMRLGLALLAAGRAPEAEAPLRAAVALDPASGEAWDNLAYGLKALDRLPAALAAHERALALRPRQASAWYNYGLTLAFAGRVDDALAAHRRAQAEDPGYARAVFGQAQALQQANRLRDAVAAYDDYLAREPRHTEAMSYRLFALQSLDGVARADLHAAHVAYGRAVGVRPVPVFPHEPAPDRRLRLAILSPDLREHSCAYFLEPLLAHLDPAAFELVLYHDHFRHDAVSDRLRARAAVWRNFVGRPADAVEETIRADRPDLLVDLAGHTGLVGRLPLFARHLAPVQVTYLGYPDTTGLPAIGYRFTDAVADPPGDADAFATERLVRFAPTAWCYAPPAATPPAEPPGGRPAGPPVFGCFNNAGKVSDTTLALWARVLAAVPGARLKLKGRGLGEPGVCARLLERCAACGLPAGRVELLERTPDTAAHLALYHDVDVALDTFPYHGTTTTCEALWMGVPVVSLRGDRHASRVGASLLAAVGHPEWVAASADDYVRTAAALAAERPARAAVRAALQGSPLLDHAGQSARFATALRSCWQDWCATRAAAAA